MSVLYSDGNKIENDYFVLGSILRVGRILNLTFCHPQ